MMPPLRTGLSKSSPVPSVYGGTLWPDITNEKLYLYGGQFLSGVPSQFELWQYDAYLDIWSVMPPQAQSISVVRAFNGASATVENSAMSFYLGGYVGSQSELNWSGPPK